MMDVREVERKLPFSIDSNETPGSLNRPKLSNEIIESIVRNSLLPVPEGEKKREFKDYTQHILRGEKSLLDTPSFWFKSAPPLKPLSITTQELAQLGEVIKLSPVSLDSICLIEVLGLHTYAAFDALEEALRAGGEKKIRSFKITFCKHWLIGYLSQGNQFRPKIAWTYTSQEFIDNIQRLIESIQERSKISQLQYQQHYKEALRGLNLLVCLWNSDNACQILQGLCCYHLADLKPWFNQEQESSTTYQGVALWLEFITCAFKNTACFHDGNTYYLTLLEELKTFLEPTQEISCILKRQQKMLVAMWMIEEYASLYSKIVRFLDHVSSVLESLHTAHAEKLIEATDLLPIEVRIQHQEAILHFFENFLLDLMSPFTLVSILKHDIEVLVPTALKSPDVAFIETGLGKYLLMWQFEQDFLEKVANAKQQAQADLQATLLQEDALKQVEESTQESLSVLEKPVFKNRKASFKKSEAEKSPSKPVELKQPIDIGIHRGEKVRRILKAMHAHHLQPDHFTGDHEILEDQLTGCKLTLSTHGQHVSRKVTRSIQRRIREMNEARQNAAK